VLSGEKLLRIRNPKLKEAEAVYQLQKDFLGELALDLSGIKAQLQMFPEGNFIAEEEAGKNKMRALGVIFTVLWDRDFTPDFGRIHGTYPHTHHTSGTVMYIHTVVVSPEHLKKGVGTKLIGEELNLAALLQLERINVVSPKSTLPVFERLGFEIVRPIPEFLAEHQVKFRQPMLMELRLG
jgi:GNAT superfamily N-acetyltransferase